MHALKETALNAKKQARILQALAQAAREEFDKAPAFWWREKVDINNTTCDQDAVAYGAKLPRVAEIVGLSQQCVGYHLHNMLSKGLVLAHYPHSKGRNSRWWQVGLWQVLKTETDGNIVNRMKQIRQAYVSAKPTESSHAYLKLYGDMELALAYVEALEKKLAELVPAEDAGCVHGEKRP